MSVNERITFADNENFPYLEFDEEVWDEDMCPYTDYEAALDDNDCWE